MKTLARHFPKRCLNAISLVSSLMYAINAGCFILLVGKAFTMIKDFLTQKLIVVQRSPREVKLSRKAYKHIKGDFIEVCMNEICSTQYGKERMKTLQKAMNAEVHHIAPIRLGGSATSFKNLALVGRSTHKHIHKLIDIQDGGMILLPRFSGIVWLAYGD